MASVIHPPYPVRAVVLYPFPGGGRTIPSPFSRFISRAVVLFSILPGGKDSGEKARLIKNHYKRRTAPMTSRQSRHLEKKSCSFTPRLARVSLSVYLRWERTTPFGHSITAPN
ncbi:hypothetical protein CEXT_428311 [Caerostris extrusa]|uniref:Uncharacterized protein n=1 Tax=Caerostris extrusa TaxID=172846 RepID=A0AAV4X9L9_CAEEX|nr:hypothetical protein CEXT_428311 [Caerostris extrusa]